MSMLSILQENSVDAQKVRCSAITQVCLIFNYIEERVHTGRERGIKKESPLKEGQVLSPTKSKV